MLFEDELADNGIAQLRIKIVSYKLFCDDIIIIIVYLIVLPSVEGNGKRILYLVEVFLKSG